MSEEKKQGFLKGAMILSVSTIIVKAVGLLFSFPLANILNPEAYGYYNIAYTIFAVFNAAATAGLPVAVSRMVSSAYSEGRKKQADKIFSVSMIALFVVGLICSVLMFVFSQNLANLVDYPGANYTIKALAPTVFFCAIMSAIRGYFQGRSNMVPTAISQIIEAISKLVIGLGLAIFVVQRYGDGAIAAAAAIAGVSVSAALGSIYLLFYKRVQTNRDKVNESKEYNEDVSSSKSILITLAKFAIPITIGASLLYVLDVIDMSIISTRLQSIVGIGEPEAAELYGYWGATLKIFDLPGAIVIALSTSLLPVLTATYIRKDTEGVKNTTSMAMRFTFLITIPCAVGFIAFSEPLANLFYIRRPDTAAGVDMLLKIIALGVIFNGMLYTTNSVLQSLGRVNVPVINMTIGGIIKIGINFAIVGIPSIGIKGVAISAVISYFVMIVLNLIAVKKYISGIPNVFRMIMPIAFSALVMGAISYIVYLLLCVFISMRIAVLIAIVIAMFVYLVGIIVFKAIRYEDVKMLPKGDKLVRILRMEEE